MKHLLIEKKEQCLKILNFFFSKGFTRFDIPESSAGFDEDIYSLAKKIYKRGMPLQKQNLIPELSILTQDEFFFQFDHLVKSNTFLILDRGFVTRYQTFFLKVQALPHLIYTPSESSKNLDTVIEIIHAIPENTKHIFAIGGGITLDIAGFVAGLLNFNVDYLATTLLSCVDAAIGGKTGVNFPPYGKNQLGLFYNSIHLYVVPEFLKSMESTEIHCGLAEALKHAWIFGAFDQQQNLFEKILLNCQNVSFKEWENFVTLNYNMKSFIVRNDPYETKGLRSVLNFGHTIGHVLESLGQQGKISLIPHGIAVAFGMKFLIDNGIAENVNQSFYQFLNELIDLSKFKIQKIEHVTFDDILISLREDKKKTSGLKNDVVLILPKYGFLSYFKAIS